MISALNAHVHANIEPRATDVSSCTERSRVISKRSESFVMFPDTVHCWSSVSATRKPEKRK